MSKADVIRLVGQFKKSETEKIDCGNRLIAFYDNLSNPPKGLY